MAVSTLKKDRGITAVGTNRESFGAVDSFTPQKDGWAVILTNTGSDTITNPPVIRVQANGNVICELTGATLNNSTNHCCLPVKEGTTYTIRTFRTSVTNVYVYS